MANKLLKVTLLTKGIRIDQRDFPNNFLSWQTIGNNITIYHQNGKVLYDNEPYTTFIDSNGAVYSTVALLVTALQSSYTV